MQTNLQKIINMEKIVLLVLILDILSNASFNTTTNKGQLGKLTNKYH